VIQIFLSIRGTYERLVTAALGRVGVPVEEEQQLLELLHNKTKRASLFYFSFVSSILFFISRRDEVASKMRMLQASNRGFSLDLSYGTDDAADVLGCICHHRQHAQSRHYQVPEIDVADASDYGQNQGQQGWTKRPSWPRCPKSAAIFASPS
jgi:hypothetical protein